MLMLLPPHMGVKYIHIMLNKWATWFSFFSSTFAVFQKLMRLPVNQQFINFHLFYIHIFFLFMGYPFQVKLLGKPETTKFLLLIFLSLFDKLIDCPKLQVALFRVAAIQVTIFVALWLMYGKALVPTKYVDLQSLKRLNTTNYLSIPSVKLYNRLYQFSLTTRNLLMAMFCDLMSSQGRPS